MPESRWSPLERDASFDRTGARRIAPRDLSALMPMFDDHATLSFNSSTMIVRRELLDGRATRAFEGSHLPDLALVVLASLSGRPLYFDAARRTVYRRAIGSATRRVSWLKHAAGSHAHLADYASDEGAPALARWLADRAVHYDRMFRGESVVESVRAASSRQEVAGGALEYLRFLGHHPRERSARLSVWSAPLYAGGYVLAPNLARRLAIARPTAERG